MSQGDAVFNAWVHHAAQRHLVMLGDGVIGQLMAVRQNARSCQVMVNGRHCRCWVEDIVLVSTSTTWDAEMAWYRLDPWKVVDLDGLHRTFEMRKADAPPSKSWLTVTHDPTRWAGDYPISPCLRQKVGAR